MRKITRNTVENILKENPGPQRGEDTWDDFLKQHAASLWQVDFFIQKVLTDKGIREVFLIAFLHVETRRVIVAPATYHRDDAWVTCQGETFVKRGPQYCDVLVREYFAHYLTQRPHQGRDNKLLNAKQPRGRPSKQGREVEEPMVSIGVRCDQKLGGLLKSHRREACGTQVMVIENAVTAGEWAGSLKYP